MKRVAVLMSTYNGEKYIKEQIDSILSQKCEYEIDLIIRDDGSIDRTVNILNSYGNRLKWYRDENLGAGLSFLKLLYDNPGYDYYAFSDQDDFWEPEKIQVAIDGIKDREECSMYCSNALMCDAALNPLGRYVHRNMVHYNSLRAFFGLCCAQGCTCLINARFAELICSSEMPGRIVLHDSFLTCLCFAVGGYLYADEQSCIKYRMHTDNVGGLKTRAQISVMEMIKMRLRYITKKPEVCIIDQLRTILENYSDSIDAKNRERIDNIVECRNKPLRRIFFAVHPMLRDESINLSISNRIKIMLGNY